MVPHRSHTAEFLGSLLSDLLDNIRYHICGVLFSGTSINSSGDSIFERHDKKSSRSACHLTSLYLQKKNIRHIEGDLLGLEEGYLSLSLVVMLDGTGQSWRARVFLGVSNWGNSLSVVRCSFFLSFPTYGRKSLGQRSSELVCAIRQRLLRSSCHGMYNERTERGGEGAICLLCLAASCFSDGECCCVFYSLSFPLVFIKTGFLHGFTPRPVAQWSLGDEPVGYLL